MYGNIIWCKNNQIDTSTISWITSFRLQQDLRIIKIKFINNKLRERLNMKKTIIAMLAFVFVSISGISYAADKVFALVPKAMNNPFFDLARDGCKVAEKEIGGKIGRASCRERV